MVVAWVGHRWCRRWICSVIGGRYAGCGLIIVDHFAFAPTRLLSSVWVLDNSSPLHAVLVSSHGTCGSSASTDKYWLPSSTDMWVEESVFRLDLIGVLACWVLRLRGGDVRAFDWLLFMRCSVMVSDWAAIVFIIVERVSLRSLSSARRLAISSLCSSWTLVMASVTAPWIVVIVMVV